MSNGRLPLKVPPWENLVKVGSAGHHTRDTPALGTTNRGYPICGVSPVGIVHVIKTPETVR
ncbi:hypothetical protein GCM10010269_40800 [Streptomyces humidus]|uniref:Uncharacterized protein n=1 Tax=Streptomyces humidus TaxID=52259 RepID=A0A918L4V2_9ACTN|nr:hypothetical protein GCM10010269_40800 [Streptomyces humidus]